MTQYRADQQIKGTLSAVDRPRQINLIFDNTHSNMMQSQMVALWVAIGPTASLSDDVMGAARTMEMAAADEGPYDN